MRFFLSTYESVDEADDCGSTRCGRKIMAPLVGSMYTIERIEGRPSFFLWGGPSRRSSTCCHLSAKCGRALTVLSSLLTGSTDTIPMDVEGRRSARAVGS